MSLRASSNGQALEASAASRSAGLDIAKLLVFCDCEEPRTLGTAASKSTPATAAPNTKKDRMRDFFDPPQAPGALDENTGSRKSETPPHPEEPRRGSKDARWPDLFCHQPLPRTTGGASWNALRGYASLRASGRGRCCS